MIYSEYINRETKGFNDILDITTDVERIVARSGVVNGIVTIAVSSSTSAISTLEFEPGLVSDMRKVMEKLAPEKAAYGHDARWNDGNGFSHIRSSLVGTSKSIPITSKSLVLGTWQQIILMDFDNRPRSRKVFVQVFGE